MFIDLQCLHYMKGEVTLTQQKKANILGRGIWAGIAAGIVLAVFMMVIVATVLGKPLLAPVNMMGAAFLGKEALMNPGMGSIILGLIVHIIDSAILGIVFVYIARSLNGGMGANTIYGIVYGLLVWLLMAFIVLPIMNSPMAEVTGGWFVVAHLIFGVVLGLLTPVFTHSKDSH